MDFKRLARGCLRDWTAWRRLQRLTLPIPYGHHVYMVSDLSLSPATSLHSRPVREFIQLLGDIDDAAVVVVGNLFHPDATSDLAKSIDATFLAKPEIAECLRGFCSTANHQLIVLPGSDDHELAVHEGAQRGLTSLGAKVAKDLMLQVATADGVRDLLCARAVHTGPDCRRPRRGSDADRLEDPTSLARFVASRVLYRRLGPWVWFPLLALVGFDLFNTVTKIVGHFTHHHYKVHAPHARRLGKPVGESYCSSCSSKR